MLVIELNVLNRCVYRVYRNTKHRKNRKNHTKPFSRWIPNNNKQQAFQERSEGKKHIRISKINEKSFSISQIIPNVTNCVCVHVVGSLASFQI